MDTDMARYRHSYSLLLVATISYGLLMFIWFSLPAYLPVIIADVGLSNTQAGILAGAIPFVYIPLALVSGLAVDRVGPGRMIAAGALTYGLGQIGRSVGTGFMDLLAFTLLIGVGATTITFGLPKLVSILFHPSHIGRPSAIYLVGASAGSAMVFAIGRPILGPLLGGWRPLFFWSGVVAIAYALIWLAISLRVSVDSKTSESESVAVQSLLADLRLVLTHRQLQLVVVIGSMYLLVTHGIQGWLPTILETRGFSPGIAGQATSLFVAAYVIGVLTVPEYADRYGERRRSLIGCGALSVLGVAGVMTDASSVLTFLGIVTAGAGVGGISPLVRAIPTTLEGIGARLTGTAIGFIFAVGEIGGFIGPALIGLLYDLSGSYLPGLGLLAAAGLVVMAAGLALRV